MYNYKCKYCGLPVYHRGLSNRHLRCSNRQKACVRGKAKPIKYFTRKRKY